MEQCERQAAGEVRLNNIVDEYTANVTKEDESQYKAVSNIGYADAGHEMWNFYSCFWLFHKQKPAVLNYSTMQELFNALSDVTKNSGRRGSVSANSMFYVEEVDTFFVLYGIKREKTGLYNEAKEEDVYETVYRLQAVNNFGNRIYDIENWEEVEEINIVPAWIDDTMTAEDNSYFGELVFFECGETDNTSASGEEYVYGRRPDATTVSPETLVQSSLVGSIKAGDTDNSNSFNHLQVGFWFGDYSKFAPYLPHPFVDDFDTKVSWQVVNNHVKHSWTVIRSGFQASLRINNDRYGQGMELAKAIEIDPYQKYEFSFLSDTMPNVRAVFNIHGKKYLCAQIKTDITEDGMSELKKGTFYRIV